MRMLKDNLIPWRKENIQIYPIPRGGIPVAYMLRYVAQKHSPGTYFNITFAPEKADVFIDDIIDSGKTMRHYISEYKKPFHALINTNTNIDTVYWYVFPWEQGLEGDESATDIATRLLEYIGEDVTREGLRKTPQRFLKAWNDWTNGYRQRVDNFLVTFEDGGKGYDEIILIKDIPVYSKCEHHLADIFGVAHVGYIPNGKIVGLSKINRVVDMFARRLQVQERLTTQIAQALFEALNPKGVAVVIKARHMCMESRGVNQQGHTTTTSAVRGVFLDKPEARAEFMSLIK